MEDITDLRVRVDSSIYKMVFHETSRQCYKRPAIILQLNCKDDNVNLPLHDQKQLWKDNSVR